MSINGFNPNNVPEELKSQPYWLIWKSKARREGGKPTKIPCSIKTGNATSVKDLTHLGSFEEALAACEKQNASGIGFSFIEGCGIVGLDFDDCIDSDQELCPRVAELVEGLGYAEVSPSQRGIKVFVEAELDFSGANRLKNFPSEGVEIEMYNVNRFFTVTGDKIEELSIEPLEDRTLRVDGIHSQVRSAKNVKSTHVGPECGESELEDEAILKLACSAKNGAKFRDLYEGSWGKRFNSQSEADLSLCSLLAFYCNNDRDQVDRLFRNSALYREKWDEKHGPQTYGEITTEKAISGTTKTYGQDKQVSPDVYDWPALLPLDDWETPEWPPGLLPEGLESFTNAVSEANQTPRAQSRMMTIPVLSAALQSQYQIEVQGRFENLATYVCVAASTGERKSADLKLVKSPLVVFEKDSQRLTMEKHRENKPQKELLLDRVEVLRKKAAKGTDDDADYEFLSARAELDKLTDLTRKRLLAQDVTPEKLAVLMLEQKENIALLSAEGGPLENVKNPYLKNANVSNIFLEGFSGDEVTVDRKRDEAVKLYHPSLTMGVMTQPGHLTSILGDRDYQGRGLLERFLYCLPCDRIGFRTLGKKMPHEALENYSRVFKKLLPPPGFHCIHSDFERRTLCFEDEGLQTWEKFSIERLEPRLRPCGDLREVRGWASRLPTAVLKLAALWYLFECANRGELTPRVVPNLWVTNAVAWVEEFAIPMGLKTFGLMGADPGLEMGKQILRHIKRRQYESFKRSEFKQSHFKSTPADEVNKGYLALIEFGYLRETKAPTKGRSATVFEVNPAVHEDRKSKGFYR